MHNTIAPSRPNAWGSRLLAGLLAAGIALTLAAGGTAPAFAAAEDPNEDTIGISARPQTDDGATARSRFSYQMSPGQSLADSYVITNTGSVAQTFTVFATDAFNTDDGGYGLLDTGVTPVDAGAWVTFDGAGSLTLDMQPGESRSVDFSVHVPDNAAPGDHAGGIVVSAASSDGEVLMDRRLGTRVYVRVPGELQPTLSIASISASYTPTLNPFAGETTVTFTVTNSGNVALAGTLKADVKGLFGIGLATPVEQYVDEMLPGNTRTVTAVIPGVGQWVYLNPTVTVYPEIEADALNPGPLTSVTRDTVVFALPWAFLALLVVGLLVWGGIVLGRGRDRRRADEWIRYTEEEARRKAAAEREDVVAGASHGGGER